MSIHIPPLLTYALRRILQAIPIMLLIMVGSFLLIKMAPGDTVDALVGDMGGADPAFVARLRLAARGITAVYGGVTAYSTQSVLTKGRIKVLCHGAVVPCFRLLKNWKKSIS